MHLDYLEKILKARVYDVAIESPLELAPVLSRRLGNRLLLKREDLQPVFSFKLRGAYNKMANLPAAKLARGVIAASAGNHAQGVALAAQKLGCRAVIVMPVTTPKIKVDAVAARGAQVILRGDSYSDAYRHAMRLKRKRGLSFVHPYDDPDVIAGQGTVGMEILRQTTRPIHAVFVPVGGGGLIAGIAAYIKRLRPAVRVIGVQPVDGRLSGVEQVHVVDGDVPSNVEIPEQLDLPGGARIGCPPFPGRRDRERGRRDRGRRRRDRGRRRVRGAGREREESGHAPPTATEVRHHEPPTESQSMATSWSLSPPTATSTAVRGPTTMANVVRASPPTNTAPSTQAAATNRSPRPIPPIPLRNPNIRHLPFATVPVPVRLPRRWHPRHRGRRLAAAGRFRHAPPRASGYPGRRGAARRRPRGRPW